MRCPLDFFCGQVRACCMCSVPQNRASIRKMPISHCTISGFVVIEIQRAIERWGGDVRNVLQRLVKILSFQNVALPKWYLCHFVFMSPLSVSRVWILIRDSVDLCDIMKPHALQLRHVQRAKCAQIIIFKCRDSRARYRYCIHPHTTEAYQFEWSCKAVLRPFQVLAEVWLTRHRLSTAFQDHSKGRRIQRLLRYSHRYHSLES